MEQTRTLYLKVKVRIQPDVAPVDVGMACGCLSMAMNARALAVQENAM
jgi:hypothetical protein